MKLTKLLSLLVFAIVAFSCNKDDDSDEYNYSKDNLTGTYSLTSYKTKKVKTIMVEGFDVVTTTVSTGDTFNVTTTFDSNNILTINGTYRIMEVKTQGDEREESAYIVVVDNEEKSYSVNASTSELTFGGKTYKVSEFSRTGFKIKMEKTTVEPNDGNTVYTEEWVFKK